ncbi:hypothetical protein P4E94_11425 [Pontiellaceae bacterium B12219]|nr:hypothetical protein [Pontiellaceae bacterium B12219]
MKKTIWTAGVAMMVVGLAQASLVYSTDFSVPYNSGNGAFVLGGATPDISTNEWFGSSNGVGVNNDVLTLGNTSANRFRGSGIWLDAAGWATGLVTVKVAAADFSAGTDSEAIFQAYAATGVDASNSVSLDLHGAQSTGADPIATGTATIGALGAEQYINANGTATFTFNYNGTDQYIGLVFANSNDPSTGTGNTVVLDNLTVNTIPEPATMGLIAAFGGGLLFIRRLFLM